MGWEETPQPGKVIFTTAKTTPIKSKTKANLVSGLKRVGALLS